ncbi:helix-turn-helix domain-containing protein [Urbifossiella limnaea]|uniref:Helix-turn-helix protein n=1 Tax=Urbifossiella limnaea TaxID=2528023 RepID=A0A517XW52_9BACT|nr:helix-turn-helix transcriptional regulator [Urbifossiella limnaea]QDU21736.1 helix-turn-helix protein [Urbifossiella limnaea]
MAVAPSVYGPRASTALPGHQLRKEKGVSQEAFAHQIQIDRSYFGSIERGERNVSLDNICLIAAGLGVPPSELLRFDAVRDVEPARVDE